MRPVPQRALELIKKWERCRLVCFSTDGSGTPTIGWGRTRGLTRADVGVRTISQDTADAYLDIDAESAAMEMERQIGTVPIMAMTDNQYSVLIDLMYNEGELGPTIIRLLKARNFDAVPPELARYVYVHLNGRPVKNNGLVNRRADEQVVWAEGEPGTSDAHVPSGVTQTTETPPAPSSDPPMHRRGSFVTAAMATGGSALAAVAPSVQGAVDGLTRVSDRIAPYADANSHVADARSWILGTVAVLATTALVAVWVADWLKRRAAAPISVARAPVPVIKPMAVYEPEPEPVAAEPEPEPVADPVELPPEADLQGHLPLVVPHVEI